MRCLASVLLTAALLLTAPAGAQTLYEGTVGTSPIVLELEKDSEEAFGHYFYRRTRFDIDISGERHGDAFKLESRPTADRFVLKRQGARLTGTLTTSKGRTLPVALRVTAPPAPPAGAPENLDGYARMQLASLSFTMGESVRVGTRRIRWYREPVSGIRLFRLEDGYAPDALREINAALAQTQWQHVQNWFDCSGYGGGTGVDTDEASTPYLDDRFVSYAWQSAWGCAGTAHPDFGTHGITYDARTGAQLKLEDLLQFGTKPKPAEDSSPWYDYRGKQFAPGLVALLKRYHPEEMAEKDPNADEGECNYADPEVWDFPAWYLTADGLFVGAYFARVERACDAPDWAVLPWKALNGPAARK